MRRRTDWRISANSPGLVADITQLPITERTPESIFGLENGAFPLWRYFSKVTRHVQENNLNVTAVEPLVAYVRSGWLYKGATDSSAMEQEFRVRVQKEIDANGAFYITKAVGLFVAG